VVIHIHHALSRAEKRTEATIVALFLIQHRSLDSPTPGIQTKKQLVGMRPSSLFSELKFFYHTENPPSVLSVHEAPNDTWKISNLLIG
jgi:hypothetical protein